MDSATRTWIRDNVPIPEAEAKEDRKRDRVFGPWSNADYQRHATNELLRQLIRATQVAGGGKPRGKWTPTAAPKPKIQRDDTAWIRVLEEERARQEERRKAAGLPSVAEMGRVSDAG